MAENAQNEQLIVNLQEETKEKSEEILRQNLSFSSELEQLKLKNEDLVSQKSCS